MNDKCFFCKAEGKLILQCQQCNAYNIKKTLDVFNQLAALAAERDELKRQLATMTELKDEWVEKYADLKVRLEEDSLSPNLKKTILQQRNDLAKEVLELRWKTAQQQHRLEEAKRLLMETASLAEVSDGAGIPNINFCKICDCEWGYGHKGNCIVGKAQSFLTPAKEITPGPETVLVRRDDVKIACQTYPESGLTNVNIWYRRRCDALDRLKATLGTPK